MTTTDPRAWLAEAQERATQSADRATRGTPASLVARKYAPAMAAALTAVLDVSDQWAARAASDRKFAATIKDETIADELRDVAGDLEHHANVIRRAITDHLKDNK